MLPSRNTKKNAQSYAPPTPPLIPSNPISTEDHTLSKKQHTLNYVTPPPFSYSSNIIFVPTFAVEYT